LWWLFHIFVAAHIATGAIGLVLFWVPVLGRKGSATHRRIGDVFTRCILATGISALAMSLCTLYDPLVTHPDLPDAVMVRALFGWMMFYLAILTISLVWHGRQSIRNKADHLANRAVFSVALQVSAILAALNCAAQGVVAGQPLMLGIAVVGVASGGTNLWFIYTDRPARLAYLKEHLKALVGSGISVYTAFMTFGLARLLPQHAFNPTLWAIPIVIGVSIILYHFRRLAPARVAAAPGT
jgi:succinate dehydrogenase hydrophobic anchor subunit